MSKEKTTHTCSNDVGETGSSGFIYVFSRERKA